MNDPIHNPGHYTVYPVQPIEIARHLGFCLGNAVKYVLRAPYKGGIEDCNKALKYLDWEAGSPAQDVAHWRALLINDFLDTLIGHLQGMENTNPWDDDITDIQAEFLLTLKVYIEEPLLGVEGLRDYVGDLVRVIAGKAKEVQA